VAASSKNANTSTAKWNPELWLAEIEDINLNLKTRSHGLDYINVNIPTKDDFSADEIRPSLLALSSKKSEARFRKLGLHLGTAALSQCTRDDVRRLLTDVLVPLRKEGLLQSLSVACNAFTYPHADTVLQWAASSLGDSVLEQGQQRWQGEEDISSSNDSSSSHSSSRNSSSISRSSSGGETSKLFTVATEVLRCHTRSPGLLSGGYAFGTPHNMSQGTGSASSSSDKEQQQQQKEVIIHPSSCSEAMKKRLDLMESAVADYQMAMDRCIVVEKAFLSKVSVLLVSLFTLFAFLYLYLLFYFHSAPQSSCCVHILSVCLILLFPSRPTAPKWQ
jgi:hypothetical protein